MTGFGSVINRFPENHDQRLFNTTFEDFHGSTKKPNPLETVKQMQYLQREAGTNPRPVEDQKVKVTSCLTGESYSKDVTARAKRDPQEQTDVQRAWLYTKDPAVTAANGAPALATSTMQAFDNQLSLPLGDGVWALKPKSDQPGFYRRIRQDVTIQKNQVISRK